MHPNPQNPLADVTLEERSQKALRDPSNAIKPQIPEKSFFPKDALVEKSPEKGELKRIIGLQITPSDLKALVEWKQNEKPSWESIRNFSRIGHFLEESAHFDKYFMKAVRSFRNKFVNVPPRFRRFCRRSQAQATCLDFPFSEPPADLPPNLVCFFSSNYFSVPSSSFLQRRISKKKKVFFYVRNPQSVDSSTKSEISSTHQDHSLILKDRQLVSNFLGKGSSFDSHDDFDSQEKLKEGSNRLDSPPVEGRKKAKLDLLPEGLNTSFISHDS